MRIEIWSDIACPWCYVGKRRFERALAQFEHRDAVEVVWRSYELDPRAPRQQNEPLTTVLARKYGVTVTQAEAMNARLATEAAKEGLAPRFDRVRMANTFDAHRLAHVAAARGKREAMLERLFAAYFVDGESLGDLDVLARVAAEVGLDDVRAELEGGAYADVVRADEERARELGVDGVPFFAIDERYGISGAQPAEVHLQALRQAWAERDVAPVPPADACDDSSCVP